MGNRPTLRQRLALWRSIRRYRQLMKSDDRQQENRLLLILQPDSGDLRSLFPPLTNWLDQHPGIDPFFLHLDASSDTSFRLHYKINHIVPDADNLKKNGLPLRSFIESTFASIPKMVINCNVEYHPLAETVFAYLPSRFKVAGWNAKREEYANLLIKLDQEYRQNDLLARFLDSLDVFGGLDS